jgi:hypothetical protein
MGAGGTRSAGAGATSRGGSTLAMTVSDLDITLLQPAIGIADANSYHKGFPKGALYLQGDIVVDGKSYTIRGVNEEPVIFTARDDHDPRARPLPLNRQAGRAPLQVQLQSTR